MAAKAWGSQLKTVEEIFFQNDAVSLCLLVNRRTRVMRVIDFRAGPTNAKRLVVLSLARREGMHKVYTLVERDEVQTWQKLGLAKEGCIPGFYKRSDAFLMGCSVDPAEAPAPEESAGEGMQSETRLAVAQPGNGPQPLSEAHQRMERTVVLAKRAAKELSQKPVLNAKILAITETEARKAVAAAQKSGRALAAFEPFGRDVERRYAVITSKGGYGQYASIESQACFGNVYIELLEGPRSASHIPPSAAALGALCDSLLARGDVSCFSLSPTDDVALATIFVHSGFRRTGMLAEHLAVDGRRKDAILWSRKLANPGEE